MSGTSIFLAVLAVTEEETFKVPSDLEFNLSAEARALVSELQMTPLYFK